MSDYNIWYTVPFDYAPSDFSKKPWSLNYKTGLNHRPHPVIEWTKGEVQFVKYYENYDRETGVYSNLLLRVEFDWIRDDNNRLIERRDTRKWTVSGSTDTEPVYGSDVKIGSKIYTTQMSDSADRRRRNNIVNLLIAQAEDFGATVFNQTMFRILNAELFAYLETGDPSLLSAITSYVDPDGVPWLDAQVPNAPAGYTVRMAIVSQLDLSV